MIRASFLLFVAAFGAGIAAAPLPGKEPVLLGPHMAIAHDRSLTIREVSSPAYANKFAAAPSPIPNFGMAEDAVWVRFDLANPSPQPRRLLVEVAMPHLDDVRLYVPEGALFHEYTGGRIYPFSTRAIPHENFVFPFELPAYFQGTIYMRFEQEGSFQLPLYLWDEDSFYQFDRIRQFLLGAYYGIAVVMLIYNLFLWISIRERAYIYYVLAILFTHGLVVFHMNGYSYAWFFPETPVIAKRSYPVLLNLAAIFSIQFLRTLLYTAKKAPLLDRGLVWLARAAGAMAAVGLFGAYFFAYRLSVYMALVTCCSLLISSGYCALRGDRIAVYYLAAWSVLVAAAVLVILRTMGIAPVGFATEYGVQIAAAIEVVLLSLALGERINVVRRDRDRITAELRERQQAQMLAVSLRQLSVKIGATLDHKELEDHLRRALPEVVRADSVYLLLLSDEGLRSPLGAQNLPPEAEMVRVLKGTDPEIIPHNKTQALLVPVHGRTTPAGLLVLVRPERFPDDEIDLLRAVAAEIGMALENIRLFLEMHHMATVDSVTGLFSRPHFMNVAALEFERAKRYKRPLSAVMLDIDFFKEVNDAYGHQAGDDVLQRIAKICRETLREVDITGRYGGDEFCFLLPETQVRGARELAERVRKRIEKEQIRFTGKEELHVTVSLGAAALDKKDENLKDLLSRADAALLQVKKSGKNRVNIAR